MISFELVPNKATQSQVVEHDFPAEVNAHDIVRNFILYQQQPRSLNDIPKYLEQLSEHSIKYLGVYTVPMRFRVKYPQILFYSTREEKIPESKQTFSGSMFDFEQMLKTDNSECKSKQKINDFMRDCWMTEVPITNLNGVSRFLSQTLESSSLDASEKAKVMEKVVETYLWNMELYRLSKDTSGIIVRWGEANDFDQNTPETLSYIGMEPKYIQDLSRGKRPTYWHRLNKIHENGYYGHPICYVWTVQEAIDAGYLITVDTGEFNALILIDNSK